MKGRRGRLKKMQQRERGDGYDPNEDDMADAAAVNRWQCWRVRVIGNLFS